MNQNQCGHYVQVFTLGPGPQPVAGQVVGTNMYLQRAIGWSSDILPPFSHLCPTRKDPMDHLPHSPRKRPWHILCK